MDGRFGKDAKLKTLLLAALEGRLTDEQAEELTSLDARVVKVVLLATSQRIAELQGKPGPSPADHPSTPSGQRPVYTKPPVPKRKGKPGATASAASDRSP